MAPWILLSSTPQSHAWQVLLALFYVVLWAQFPLLSAEGGHQEGVYMGMVILQPLLLPFLLQANMHSYLNVQRYLWFPSFEAFLAHVSL